MVYLCNSAVMMCLVYSLFQTGLELAFQQSNTVISRHFDPVSCYFPLKSPLLLLII